MLKISVTSLYNSVKIMHITDSHISVIDDSEKDFHKYSKRMDGAFPLVTNYKTGEPTNQKDEFLNLLKIAKEKNVDLIILTGDIINNPSKSSLEFIYQALIEADIPYIYTAGNHDWHYEGMPGSQNELRETWIQKTLLPLYNGKNPLCSSQIIKGINFVAIDNTTYQINQQQFDFFKQQKTLPLPIVLLIHIPFYLNQPENNILTCGNPDWGWDNDKGYKAERRERWSKAGNSQITIDFRNEVINSKNLVCILSGHLHKEKAEKINDTAIQYVTSAAATGKHRLITFEPLEN